LLALADGVVIPGVTAVRVTQSGNTAADRVQLTFAFNAASAGYWDSWMAASLEVRVAVDSNWSSIFLGVVDLIEFDVVGGTVEIEGRDLTALLIDLVVEESYPNLTASDIAQKLATQVGLTPAVTATTGLVGRYWGSDWSRLALGNYGKARSGWDLLVWLAAQESFDVYVTGNRLYFGLPSANSASATVIYPSDCITLKLERSLRLAGNIEITVRSWNSRTKTGCSPTASVSGSGSNLWRKIFVRPNLQIADAEQFAMSEAVVLSQHERVVTACLPGELSIGPRNLLTIFGSGIDFDQTYVVDEVERVISAEKGFVEYVRARAASPGRNVSFVGSS
jgi:hypothetical protein